MSSGREEFLKMLSENRKARIQKTADQYAKLPPNIRAAIAKVAGVENERLDRLSVKDRAALFKAVKDLREKVDRAYLILIAAQTLD